MSTSPHTTLLRRSVRLLAGVTVVYALLVATHLGEFWPFSIYPMFSQAGHPWSRVVVRDVTQASPLVTWDTLRADALPGTPFALEPHGVNAIDLGGFMANTSQWSGARIEGLRRMFAADRLDERRLLIVQVRGRIVDNDAVAVTYVPQIELAADTVRLHPGLPR